MRKPSCDAREWNRIHARESDRRRLTSKRKLKSERRKRSSVGPGRSWRSTSRSVTRRQGTANEWSVECPQDFSLRSNFDAVVDVIHRIRHQSARLRNERTYIDFRQIRQLSPGAALVMAAELDRWNYVRPGKRLGTVDVDDWDPDIRRLLDDMGFFSLLDVPGRRPADAGSDDQMRYVKFRTGRVADGEAFTLLRTQDLEPIVGEMPRKEHLYAAVTEAMTNVVQHAYGLGARRPHWWLAGSRNGATGQVSVMIYDQGIGIPETLPRRYSERLRGFLPGDHARMIRAAHDLKRSATDEPHRGHGLERDIRGYLNFLDCQASYRVVSLKGEYTYTRNRDGVEKDELKSHSNSLNGTLIEWNLALR